MNLYPVHHELGPDAPHRNRAVDVGLKRELQEKYFELFGGDKYPEGFGRVP